MAYEPIIESFEDEHDIDIGDNDNDSNVVVDIDHERRIRRQMYNNFSILSTTTTTTTATSNTRRSATTKWKLIASFWILGLLNNSSYVIMIACAKNISEGRTGLVFLANVVPSLVVKASAPYWFHSVSYETRLSVATLSMALSFLLVAVASNDHATKQHNNNDNTTNTLITTYKLCFQLLGVAFGSAQAGLGEASLLALAGKTDGAAAAAATSRSSSSNNNNNNSKGQCLTSFSSGTGMAGVFGFFWKWWWNDFWGFTLSTTLYLALTLAVGYLTTFRYSMTHQPPSDQENRNNNNGYDYDDENNDIKYDIKLRTIETELSPITNNNNDEEENTTTTTTTTTTMPPSETLALNVNDVTSLSQQQSQAQQQVVVGYDTHDSNSSDAIVILEIDEMTGGQRFRLVLSLWPYMIPLFVVYAAEYALQAGTWSAMGFPIDDRESRDRFYEFSNWMYQAGVFLSRSSGTLFTAPIWVLWLMPALQTLNLIVFCFVASHPMTSLLYKPGLLFTGAFYTGLLGGAVYICGYKRICADLPLAHREFALSATSVAEGLGIVVADALGLVIQACLYHINGLEEATLSCPFD